MDPYGIADVPDERTGDTEVDRILSRLDELEGKPLPAHVEVFDAVHGVLQDHLARTEG